jgi:hypothetical protein
MMKAKDKLSLAPKSSAARSVCPVFNGTAQL